MEAPKSLRVGEFGGYGRYSEWPKVADTVIEALQKMQFAINMSNFLFLKNRWEVAGRMQNAKHFHALPGSSIKDEIVLKSGDRQDTHTLETFALKRPGTIHAWQRDKLRTCRFQCRHKTR